MPFTPGGTTDILAREIAAKLQVAFGQSCIVENRPGGGGTLGCEMVARADPDGLTMLMGHIGTLAINPLVYPHHGYDPVTGWTPLAYVANVPNVLAVNASVPAQSVQELVALAKSKPGALAYGTGGTASASHLASAYFAFATGTEFLHVPYKGTAPFVSDLLGGQLQMGFTGAPVVMPLAKQGRLRALAVSSAKRSEAFPELPTIAEFGRSRLRSRSMVRHHRPGRDRSRDRQGAQRRDQQGAGVGRREGAPGKGRRRRGDRAARGAGPAHRGGDRALAAGGEGGEHPAGVARHGFPAKNDSVIPTRSERPHHAHGGRDAVRMT